MKELVARTGRGLYWYLKQASGEAKWDEYLEHCRRNEHDPMPRGEFERQRSDAKEAAATSRCC
jgi:uncharacterized short protein YbdD (DUF466 family)